MCFSTFFDWCCDVVNLIYSIKTLTFETYCGALDVNYASLIRNKRCIHHIIESY